MSVSPTGGTPLPASLATWHKIRKFGRRNSFVITVVAGVLGGIYTCVRMYDYSPPPTAGLEFTGWILDWLRPDMGLSDDLKMMGYKNYKSKAIGMSSFEVLMGQLKNNGNRDAADIEIKVPVNGNLRYSRVAGVPDNLGNLSEAEQQRALKNSTRLSDDDVVVAPGQYVKIGSLRPDDPTLFITLFTTTGELTSITFRYREGDATKIVQYVVKRDPKTIEIRISRVVLWSMDAQDLKRFARNSGIGIVLLGIVLIAAYYQWHRISPRLVHLWSKVRSLWPKQSPPADGTSPVAPPPPAPPIAASSHPSAKDRRDMRRKKGKRKR